jgi:hypothetical protein
MKNINKMIASVIAGVMLSTSAMATLTTEMKWVDTINVVNGCTFENRQEGVMNWNETDSAFYSSTGAGNIASIIVTNIGGTSVNVASDGKLWYRSAGSTGEYQEVQNLLVTMDYRYTGRLSTIENRTGTPTVTSTRLEVSGLTAGGSTLDSMVMFNIKGRAVVSIVNIPTGPTPSVDDYFPQGNNDYFIRHTITCTQ